MCEWCLCFLLEWQDDDQCCLYKIIAMISLLYFLLAFFSWWVGIPTSKSQVEIPCIGCKNGYNGSYVHDVWVLKTECFLNSYCPNFKLLTKQFSRSYQSFLLIILLAKWVYLLVYIIIKKTRVLPNTGIWILQLLFITAILGQLSESDTYIFVHHNNYSSMVEVLLN